MNRLPFHEKAGIPPLFPFQDAIMRRVHDPNFRTVALSMPRGNGKTFLAALLLHDLINENSDRFLSPGQNALCLASTLDQARLVFNYLRAWLDHKSSRYQFADSVNLLSVRHRETGAKIRAISSNGKSAMGLVGVPFVVADEPGAWQVTGGALMHSALQTAQGKLGSDLRVMYIGTLAPSMRGWWPEMVNAGTSKSDGRFVFHLSADPKKWDRWPEIKRVNPVTSAHDLGVKVLKSELRAAQRSSRQKAEFLSYRLNVPAGDESTVLLTLAEWDRCLARKPEPMEGQPVIGVDLGASRAWSAAVAIWPTHRVEAFAVCPGIPDISEQEQRDRVPAGSYQSLVDDGHLIPARGLRVVPPAMVADMIRARWPNYCMAVADRFRESELLDAGLAGLVTRVTMWSQASEDIRALRRMAADGRLSVNGSADLIAESLCATEIKSDESGNMRMVKKGYDNMGRDDVAAALVLAAGETMRRANLPEPEIYYA